MLQCWIVGVKVIRMRQSLSSTVIDSSERTLSCSSEYGCSGSLISLT
uniref:Protein AE7-like 1 n=1 Tax=Rhizophora mucronata TaxID=61149 RepID=A0A2P2J8N4_RHIMU